MIAESRHKIEFQKNLVVWKPIEHRSTGLGEKIVSEELSSVETTPDILKGRVLSQFQKNLVVWKLIFYLASYPINLSVSEELSSVETRLG